MLVRGGGGLINGTVRLSTKIIDVSLLGTSFVVGGLLGGGIGALCTPGVILKKILSPDDRDLSLLASTKKGALIGGMAAVCLAAVPGVVITTIPNLAADILSIIPRFLGKHLEGYNKPSKTKFIWIEPNSTGFSGGVIKLAASRMQDVVSCMLTGRVEKDKPSDFDEKLSRVAHSRLTAGGRVIGSRQEEQAQPNAKVNSISKIGESCVPSTSLHIYFEEELRGPIDFSDLDSIRKSIKDLYLGDKERIVMQYYEKNPTVAQEKFQLNEALAQILHQEYEAQKDNLHFGTVKLY